MSNRKAKSKIIKRKPIFRDKIDEIEKTIGIYVNIYAGVLGIVLLGLIVYCYKLSESIEIDIDDLATSFTCFIMALAGWAALKTWQVSFIFNLEQERRAMTLQQLMDHLNSNVYNESKEILRVFFPTYIDSIEVKILPSISTLKKEKNIDGRELTQTELENIENAFETLLNSYEQIASAIIEGYLDQSYLKENIRGQLVRVCGLFSKSIKEANKESKKNLEHVIELYYLWHELAIDGVQCDLRGPESNQE